MMSLLRLASSLDIDGEHRLADIIDRLVMSQAGYYPPPPPKEDFAPQDQEIDEGPSLGGNIGEPPLYGDPNKKQQASPLKPSPRRPKTPLRKIKFAI